MTAHQIVVTGASGQLGRLVVEALLERGVTADRIVATARDTSKIADLADRGVQIRAADYTDRASLDAALAGADRVLLVSSSEVGQRSSQHQNVIDAAVAAGVDLLAYTSIAKADTGGLALAAEHLATEEALAASGLRHVLLRNGWYVENYTDQLASTLEHGTVLGAAGDGVVSAATRGDLAEAAATVLLAEDPARVHELGGAGFTLTDLAATISDVTGQAITYTDLPVEAYEAALAGAGVPAPFAAILADSDAGIARGALQVPVTDLERLLGRPATPLAEAVKAATV